MAAKVGALSLGTKHGQKGQAGHDRHEEVDGDARFFEGKTHGAEHPDDTKDGGGKTYKSMPRPMYQNIEVIGENCGEKHDGQANTVAGELEKIMEEKATQNSIAQKVHDIGMKGQSSNQAEEFQIVKDGFGIAGTLDKPYGLRLPVAGYTVDGRHATYYQGAHCPEYRLENWCFFEVQRPVFIFDSVVFNLKMGFFGKRFSNIYFHVPARNYTNAVGYICRRKDKRKGVKLLGVKNLRDAFFRRGVLGRGRLFINQLMYSGKMRNG